MWSAGRDRLDAGECFACFAVLEGLAERMEMLLLLVVVVPMVKTGMVVDRPIAHLEGTQEINWIE